MLECLVHRTYSGVIRLLEHRKILWRDQPHDLGVLSVKSDSVDLLRNQSLLVLQKVESSAVESDHPQLVADIRSVFNPPTRVASIR